MHVCFPVHSRPMDGGRGARDSRPVALRLRKQTMMFSLDELQLCAVPILHPALWYAVMSVCMCVCFCTGSCRRFVVDEPPHSGLHAPAVSGLPCASIGVLPCEYLIVFGARCPVRLTTCLHALSPSSRVLRFTCAHSPLRPFTTCALFAVSVGAGGCMCTTRII